MILLISPRFLPSSSCSATRNVPLSADEIGRKNCKIKGGGRGEEGRLVGTWNWPNYPAISSIIS